MVLSDLPPELIQLIFNRLGTESDILLLLQVNRILYNIGLPILYQYNIKHSGSSALHWCAENGNETVAKRILDCGLSPDLNTPQKAELSPLRLAIDHDHENMVKFLLDHGALANGPLLVHRAVTKGKTEVVKMLLDHGGDVNSLDAYGHTLLSRAACHGVELVQLLFDYGADIKKAEESPTRVTPLHIAAESSDNQSTDVLTLFLDHEADVNAVESSRETPLHWAASRHPDKLKILLDRGADVNPRNNIGGTPLHRASEYGLDTNMQVLLDCGADSTAVNNRGLSPSQVYRKKADRPVRPVSRGFVENR